ncbi:MAG: hypothetical protein OHK0029_01320 [Armatimonadaceae bacterium]
MRSVWIRTVPITVALAFAGAIASPVSGQELVPLPSGARRSAPSGTDSGASGVLPRTTQEVVASGTAAIGTGGVPGARKAAETIALRNAVEKALGVFVSARTLTQNYVMVRDQVMTRADGYATLKEIVDEEVAPDKVTVTVRAIVSLKPLAEQLKALKLTRAWRVHVRTAKPVGNGKPGTPIASSEVAAVKPSAAQLERNLADAGFVVVASPTDADIVVELLPSFETVATHAVEAGNLPLTMHSIRGTVSVRALRTGTSEVVAALSDSRTALHVNATTAKAQAAEDATEQIAPRLAEALLVLPAAHSQPVTLTLSGLRGVAEVGEVEEALYSVPGVQNVLRRSYERGKATWELDVFNEGAATLSRSLEEQSALRALGVKIESETRSLIRGAVHTGNASRSRKAP